MSTAHPEVEPICPGRRTRARRRFYLRRYGGSIHHHDRAQPAYCNNRNLIFPVRGLPRLSDPLVTRACDALKEMHPRPAPGLASCHSNVAARECLLFRGRNSRHSMAMGLLRAGCRSSGNRSLAGARVGRDHADLPRSQPRDERGDSGKDRTARRKARPLPAWLSSRTCDQDYAGQLHEPMCWNPIFTGSSAIRSCVARNRPEPGIVPEYMRWQSREAAQARSGGSRRHVPQSIYTRVAFSNGVVVLSRR